MAPEYENAWTKVIAYRSMGSTDVSLVEVFLFVNQNLQAHRAQNSGDEKPRFPEWMTESDGKQGHLCFHSLVRGPCISMVGTQHWVKVWFSVYVAFWKIVFYWRSGISICFWWVRLQATEIARPDLVNRRSCCWTHAAPLSPSPSQLY